MSALESTATTDASALRAIWGSRRSWSYFTRYFRQHTRAVVLYSLVTVLVSSAMVPTLVLVRKAFDIAIPTGNMLMLVALAGGILAIRTIAGAGALAVRRFVVHITKSMIAAMRADLIDKLYAIDRSIRTQADIDGLQSQVVQDSERLDVLVGGMLSTLVPAVLSAVALLVLLLVLSWQLVLVATLAFPVVWLAGRRTQRGVKREVTAFQADFRRFNQGVSFVLRQMDLTRTQAAEGAERTRQRQITTELAMSGEKMAWSYALHGQLQGALVGVVGIGLLVAGGMEVIMGMMTLGQFLAFYLGASMLSNAVLTVTRGAADVTAATISLETLAAIDGQKAAPPYGGTRRLEFTGQLALRGVSFGYGAQPLFKDLDFSILPREHVAILGPNGAGKTTALNLLLGIVRPDTGVVLADSVPYAELDLEDLRRGIGVVLQRAAFFRGTIRANICYGHEDAAETDVVAAAHLACADDFIGALPLGYDTVLGDSGITLSGGECQRLAIARAILRRPKLLILDEPTNHLDAAVVGKLLATLRQLPDSPAILIVSHDPRIAGFVSRSYHLRAGQLQSAEP